MAMQAEAKVALLKKELADAEKELVATKTIAVELKEADAVVAEARRLVRINEIRLAEALQGIEAASFAADRTYPGPYGEKQEAARRRVLLAKETAQTLIDEKNVLAADLQNKESDRAAIEMRIAEHPVYKETRVHQRKIVAQAIALARSFFTTPLDDLAEIPGKIQAVARAERDLLDSVRVSLRDAGIPEINPVLQYFAGQTAPIFLDQIPNAQSAANGVISKIEELVSRAMVR